MHYPIYIIYALAIHNGEYMESRMNKTIMAIDKTRIVKRIVRIVDE
jgi:hypothetical protein